MEYTESVWKGCKRLDFTFENREAILICPEKADSKKRWLFKTEYFGAFAGFELAMVEKGFHIAYLQNITRWCKEEDIDVKPRFCEFLQKEFGLCKKCMPVGMSCGGLQAVYFAARYPKYVACMYLDAPVLNLLSCPCGVGDATDALYAEFHGATGYSVSDLINYRNHPMDHIDELIAAKIPIFLVCGDSDRTVPYHENGKYLAEQYEKTDIPFEKVIKKDCDHHPHGLKDGEALIRFTETYYS